jgi:hypothetical protein
MVHAMCGKLAMSSLALTEAGLLRVAASLNLGFGAVPRPIFLLAAAGGE